MKKLTLIFTCLSLYGQPALAEDQNHTFGIDACSDAVYSAKHQWQTINSMRKTNADPERSLKDKERVNNIIGLRAKRLARHIRYLDANNCPRRVI